MKPKLGLVVIINVLLCTFLIEKVENVDVEMNQKCSFSMGKKTFTCIGLTDVNNNKNVDKFLTADTHMLIIKNSDKITLHSNHHNSGNYDQIISYQIVDSDQLVIESLGFKGLVNLNYLTITGNYLTQLNAGIFTGLEKLEVLNMAENNISSIDDNVFSNLPHLVTLQLSKNQIPKIRRNTFNNLKSVSNLLLAFNNIHTIESKAFATLENLEILDLTHNKINVIDADLFSPLIKLQYLYLGYNNIKKVLNTMILPKLIMIQLNDNQLKELGENVFQLDEIKNIDLANNSLRNIDEKCFRHLSNLMFLNLKNNEANATGFNLLKLRTNIIL